LSVGVRRNCTAARSNTPATDHDHFLELHRPFALDPEESITEIEDQVVALVAERLRYADSFAQGDRSNLRFSDDPFLVRRQHRQQR
jgi:hypothetical protein